MKGVKLLLLVLILSLSLVACGGQGEEVLEGDLEGSEDEHGQLVEESGENSLEVDLEGYIPILDLNKESLIEQYGQPSLQEGYGGGSLLKFEEFSAIVLDGDKDGVHSLYLNGNLKASGHDEIIAKYGHPDEEGFDMHDNVTYLLYKTEDHNVMFMDYGGENPYTKIWRLDE